MKHIKSIQQLNEDRMSEIRAKMAEVKAIKDKMGKATVAKMYKNITHDELVSALDNAEWMTDAEWKSMGTENDWVMKNYTRQSSIAGVTDYKDHTKDSIEDIKKLTYDAVKNRTMQNAAYYNINGKIFDIVRIQLARGGWSVEPGWSDGARGFSAIA